MISFSKKAVLFLVTVVLLEMFWHLRVHTNHTGLDEGVVDPVSSDISPYFFYNDNGNDNDKNWIKTGTKHLDVLHPHMGARHPNGTTGMTVDPSSDRLLPFDKLSKYGVSSNESVIAPNLLCPTKAWGFGIEGRGGLKVMQKVRRGVLKSKELVLLQGKAIAEQAAKSNKNSTPVVDMASILEVNIEPDDTSIDKTAITKVRARKSRILCLVYSVHLPPSYDNRNLRAQASTWGKKCDGFIAASNFTDHTVGAVDLPHFGPESYDNMWQKMRSMWAYAYDHYKDDYDFFNICGDDVYVAVDNLRAFVDGPQVMRLEKGYKDAIAKHYIRIDKKELPYMNPKPLIFGSPMPHRGCLFPAGGSGYTMNRAALALLVEVGLPSFLPDAIDSREDVFVGSFFCKQRVYLSDSRDSLGGLRYGETAQQAYDMKNGKNSVRNEDKMKIKMGLDFRTGIDSASAQHIAFHLKSSYTSGSALEKILKGKPRKHPNFLRRNNKQLELRRETGHPEYTTSDLLYRYHAILEDWCE